MRRWRIAIFVLLCGVAVPSADAAVGATRGILQELTPRQAPPFIPPKVTDVVLSNGMRCFFLEDALLPVLRFRLFFPAGAVYDPAEKVGLNALMMRALQQGGTTHHGAEWVDDYLDQHAMQVDVGVEWEYGSATLHALAQTADAGLRLLFEMLYTPAFEPTRLDIIKGTLREGIRRRNDGPDAIADRVFRKLLYGRQSPWARTPTETEIARLTREDLQAYHASLFAPSQMFCAAAGKFHTAELMKLLEEILAAFPSRVAGAWTPPATNTPVTPGIWLVPKSVPQSVISVGHVGLSRDSPDKFAAVVMNDVLGSPATFTSWLIQNIRTKHGLAYEAWSTMMFGPPKIPGMFYAHAKTRAEATGRAVQLLHENIALMHAGRQVTPDEVAAMKESTLKRLIFQYEDPFDVVTMMMRFVYFGFPTTYLQTYHEGIAKVSHADVVRVAKQYLHPDQLTTLVVGDPKIVRGQLTPLGSVQEFDLESEDP